MTEVVLQGHSPWNPSIFTTAGWRKSSSVRDTFTLLLFWDGSNVKVSCLSLFFFTLKGRKAKDKLVK
jgi:hypothetical protein